ncbi:hypothetical protein RIF29_38062 [Crotalaria pallida]|uniref:Uncharacterized protein n=1 Tax=Crotalaria pallida TaxID=3830 RepID=A0AAN9HNF3_CROPI
MNDGEVDEDEIYWRRRKEDKELEWSHNSTHLISQLAQCFTNAMVGSRSWIGGLFNRANTKRSSEKFIDYPLTPVEEERLQRLQEQLQVPYDETCPDHQVLLFFNVLRKLRKLIQKYTDILQEPVSIFLNQETAQRGPKAQSFHGNKLIHDVLNKGSINGAFDLTLFRDENRSMWFENCRKKIRQCFAEIAA